MVKSIARYFSDKIRLVFLRQKGVSVGHDAVVSRVDFKGTAIVEPYCRLLGDPRITVGSDFYANVACHFLGEITIGDNVMVGPKTVIWGRDHGTNLNRPMRYQPHLKEPIHIGDDVWIGANVTILKGVKIGAGCIIGAGSVVVRDVPPFSIIGGNPARVIRKRN